MEEKKTVRILVYSAGIILVSLGIVLCKNCGLGISPISSIPYCLEQVTGLSMGTLTMLFHFVNIVLQMALLGRVLDLKLWLQVPLAFLFGVTIDAISLLLPVRAQYFPEQLFLVLASIVCTALGMVCMIRMKLVQNPPDGFVRALSGRLGKELGGVKILFDCSCVAISAVLGLVFLGRIAGFGLATLLSAYFVGRSVTWINKVVDSFLDTKEVMGGEKNEVRVG